MANKQNTRGRNGLIHCDNCGEDYSSTYKRCPFCDEYEEEYEAPAREHRRQSSGRGGKRLANTAKPERSSSRSGSRRSGIDIFYWVPRIISVLVIVAAIWIVVTKIMPMVDRGDVGTIDPDAGQSQQQDGNLRRARARSLPLSLFHRSFLRLKLHRARLDLYALHRRRATEQRRVEGQIKRRKHLARGDLRRARHQLDLVRDAFESEQDRA